MTTNGVVRYANYLFTRNQQRDFTAFVRPPLMSNKDVSALANAFNFVNDITPLTADAPALYCFPLGPYLYILRHYDSGRKHAGRAIPIIEGVAIRREEENALGILPAQIIGASALLDVAATVGDIEVLERQTSPVLMWTPDADEPNDESDDTDADDDDAALEEDADTITDALAQRYGTDWLLLPFNDFGRGLLLDALSDKRLPILHFAFGSNPNVIAQFKQSGITFDVIGFATVDAPEFRPRDAEKAIDAREILPEAAAGPTNFAPTDAVPPMPDDLAEGRTASVSSGEPIMPIYEERVRKRRRRRRSLLQRIVDVLLGR